MPAALRSKTLFLLIAGLVIAVTAGAWFWSQRASLKPEAVRVGMPTAKVRISWKTFSYNEQGHFGSKTQFESRNTDALGGSYSLHCRDGKVYAVEINYPQGAQRPRLLEIAGRIAGHSLKECDEHDDKELSLKDCAKPSEYFYFEGGKIGLQLDYARRDPNCIARVYCWSA